MRTTIEDVNALIEAGRNRTRSGGQSGGNTAGDRFKPREKRGPKSKLRPWQDNVYWKGKKKGQVKNPWGKWIPVRKTKSGKALSPPDHGGEMPPTGWKEKHGFAIKGMTAAETVAAVKPPTKNQLKRLKAARGGPKVKKVTKRLKPKKVVKKAKSTPSSSTIIVKVNKKNTISDALVAKGLTFSNEDFKNSVEDSFQENSLSVMGGWISKLFQNRPPVDLGRHDTPGTIQADLSYSLKPRLLKWPGEDKAKSMRELTAMRMKNLGVKRIKAVNKAKGRYLVTAKVPFGVQVKSGDYTFEATVVNMRVTISKPGNTILVTPHEVSVDLNAITGLKQEVEGKSKRDATAAELNTSRRMLQNARSLSADLIIPSKGGRPPYRQAAAYEELSKEHTRSLERDTNPKKLGYEGYWSEGPGKPRTYVTRTINKFLLDGDKRLAKLLTAYEKKQKKTTKGAEASQKQAKSNLDNFGVENVLDMDDKWPAKVGKFSFGHGEAGYDKSDPSAFDKKVTYLTKFNMKADSSKEEITKMVKAKLKGFIRLVKANEKQLTLAASHGRYAKLKVPAGVGTTHWPNAQDKFAEIRISRAQGKKGPKGPLKVLIAMFVQLNKKLSEDDALELAWAHGDVMTEQAVGGHQHSAKIVRQVASIVTNADKSQNWKFSADFLKDPVNELNLAYGTAQTPGRGMTTDPKKPADVWKLRLAQYEAALAHAKKARGSESKKDRSSRLNRRKKALGYALAS